MLCGAVRCLLTGGARSYIDYVWAGGEKRGRCCFACMAHTEPTPWVKVA